MKAEWGRLTDNDRRRLEGRIDQLLGLFQERYGYTRAHAAVALKGYLGTQTRKPAPVAVLRPKGRLILFATLGLALISAIGWVAFSKLLSGQQLPSGEEENADVQPDVKPDVETDVGAFEAEDFEALLLGYDGALA
jgi:uncharacterized protein YjbJ (UPF0337 family)